MLGCKTGIDWLNDTVLIKTVSFSQSIPVLQPSNTKGFFVA